MVSEWTRNCSSKSLAWFHFLAPHCTECKHPCLDLTVGLSNDLISLHSCHTPSLSWTISCHLSSSPASFLPTSEMLASLVCFPYNQHSRTNSRSTILIVHDDSSICLFNDCTDLLFSDSLTSNTWLVIFDLGSDVLFVNHAFTIFTCSPFTLTEFPDN